MSDMNTRILMSDVTEKGGETRHSASMNVFTGRTGAKKLLKQLHFRSLPRNLIIISPKSPRAAFENQIIFVVLTIQHNQTEIRGNTLCDK